MMKSITTTLISVFFLATTPTIAFVPVGQQQQQQVTASSSSSSSTSSLNAAFENELGAQDPLGYYDPLGVLSDGSQAKFDRLRFVEIKHGRICMLGVVGFLINKAGIYLPGAISLDGTQFSDCGYGFDALSKIPSAGIIQIAFFIGFLELGVMKDATGDNEFIGDFRNGFLDFGWSTFDEETKLKKRAIELNQGRAAQMGMLGLMVHDQLGNLDLIIPNLF